MKVADFLIESDIISNKISKIGVTRDDKDVKVMRCEKTGVIFLDVDIDSKERIKKYKKKKGIGSNKLSIKEIKRKTKEDDKRRANMLKNKVLNKNVVDVGAGFGGFLDIIKNISESTTAIELQKEAKEHLNERHKTYERIKDVEDGEYDIATMFHVLEHMWKPLDELKKLKQKITKGGTLVVEVPHARDALIDLYDVEEFKNFTFWSEHLILHTRQSLRSFLTNAGFKNITVKGIQRYSLANHMYWMCNGEPGGGSKWSFMDDECANKEYEKLLASIDKTDTLLAFCKV